jgi:radical SAM protein with 4Fe4S-binding SPASM domain
MIYEREIASIVRNILIPGNGCYMCAASPCGAGTQHVGLDVNGDVYVCDTFYGLADYVIGNMLEQPVDEILKNPLVERFKRRTVKTIPKCSTCHLNEWCYGGCPAHNVFFYGEEGFDRESHMCSWFMKIIPFLKEQFEQRVIDPELLSDLPAGTPITTSVSS